MLARRYVSMCGHFCLFALNPSLQCSEQRRIQNLPLNRGKRREKGVEKGVEKGGQRVDKGELSPLFLFFKRKIGVSTKKGRKGRGKVEEWWGEGGSERGSNESMNI